MITIGFIEEAGNIKNLTSHFFKSVGISYTQCATGDKDFVLLTPQNGRIRHFDVLVQDVAKNEQVTCNADYIHIINSDDTTTYLYDKKTIIITYGLNSLATVTASSIEQDGESIRFQYCLQRNIVSLKGKIIEWQEFPVCIYQGDLEIHTALAFVTLALVCSVPSEKLASIK